MDNVRDGSACCCSRIIAMWWLVHLIYVLEHVSSKAEHVSSKAEVWLLPKLWRLT